LAETLSKLIKRIKDLETREAASRKEVERFRAELIEHQNKTCADLKLTFDTKHASFQEEVKSNRMNSETVIKEIKTAHEISITELQ
jgi:demethoxyubiquinone hydroxylase (CLK1/Coq7/Cat5 family)